MEEVAGEVRDVRSRRDEFRAQAGDLRHQLTAKQDFSAKDASALIRGLASDTAKLDSRKRLREAIRAQLDRIELFRRFPSRLLEGLKLQVPGLGLDLKSMLTARCVRILFRNQVERWVVDDGGEADYGVRFDGAKPPAPRMAILEPDDLGGKHLVDLRKSERVLQKWEEWRRSRRATGQKGKPED